MQKFVFQAYEELFEHTPSLQFAVEQLALTWEGKQHRALADAENTANILLKVYREILISDTKDMVNLNL